MDWLRKIVSGNRRRFQDDKYNLDITYITSRVIAMSFPASGFEQIYRNNIGDVSLQSNVVIMIGSYISEVEAWKVL